MISQAPSKNKRTYWLCKCDCGNEVIKCGRDLSQGDSNSCGCLHSKGEAKLKSILNSLEIEYQSEYSFKDFLTIENIPYRFDFAVFQNNKLYCLIEYDGIQHFKSGTGWNTEESLRRNRINDYRKNLYCKNNNIPLIRIPYTDFNILDENYLKERLDQCQLIVDT